MSYFDFESKPKVGAKPKHNFEKMEVGDVKPFPEGVKLSSLRVMLSVKGSDYGMKFKVDSHKKTVERVK